jgi:hypothetical protein
MIAGVVMMLAHLPLLYNPSFDIIALHTYGYLSHESITVKRSVFYSTTFSTWVSILLGIWGGEEVWTR